MIDWLFTTALAALALAVVVAVFNWTFRPSPAVRHALWLIVVLKLVSPTGLVVSVPLHVETPATVTEERAAQTTQEPTEFVVEEELITVFVTPRPGQSAEEAAAMALRIEQTREPDAQSSPLPAEPISIESAGAVATPFDYRPYLLGVWALGAVAVGWWQVRGTLRFARLARRGLPAGDMLVAEVAIVANRIGVRVPDVRVLTGLTSPVMWCLWRPVLLWPAGLECRLKGEGRRAVLAHELAHLRRRDHWVRRLEMVAAVLHWWNPLFWIARKKMRTDAELACDAWAAGHADRRAYAEALLEVCSFNPRRRPAPAVGVIGEGRRAMQERLTMIMRDRGSCRLAFGAKLVVALMAIAAVPAWTLGQSAPAESAPAADPQIQAIEAQIKALSEKLEAVKAAKQAEAQKKAAESVKKASEALKEKVKALSEKGIAIQLDDKVKAAEGVKVITAGEGGYKVIGPDGKELKDVKIVVVDPKTSAQTSKSAPTARYWVGGDAKSGTYTIAPAIRATTLTSGQGSQAITLSRATYKLGKDQASAQATLLGGIKATVMETKVDGDTLTVTTTPEAQAAIGQIVRLLQGGTGQATYRLEWKTAPTPPTPATPMVPATPRTPKPPATPAPPAPPKKPDGGIINLGDYIELKLEGLKDLEMLKDLELDLKIDAAKLKELEKIKGLEKLKDLEKLKELEKLRLIGPFDTVPKPDPNKKPGQSV
jgi:beta-lactamase regulating signal transducer with metallopeptidase domain